MALVVCVSVSVVVCDLVSLSIDEGVWDGDVVDERVGDGRGVSDGDSDSVFVEVRLFVGSNVRVVVLEGECVRDLDELFVRLAETVNVDDSE